MDEKDFEAAERLEQLERQSGIEKARRRSHLPKPTDFNGKCAECGADIPTARVVAGYFTCIDCANEMALRERLRGRE
jgi:RNA polymerase-binding transcription factor DksA